jgi:hypothetical protein
LSKLPKGIKNFRSHSRSEWSNFFSRKKDRKRRIQYKLRKSRVNADFRATKPNSITYRETNTKTESRYSKWKSTKNIDDGEANRRTRVARCMSYRHEQKTREMKTKCLVNTY